MPVSRTDDFSGVRWPSDVVSSVTPDDVFGIGGFDPEKALAVLLLNGVCFLSGWRPDEAPDDGYFPLHVDCSDLFSRGSADGEPLPAAELRNLYAMWWKDRSWGKAIWCMIARREMPQRQAQQEIRATGVWDLDVLTFQHELRPNHYDGVNRVLAQQKYEIYCRWEGDNGRTPRAFDADWQEGWERFRRENAGWETEEWRATARRLIERFERVNGFV